MAAPKPEFTHTFFVEKDNYGDFIRMVRQNVIKYCDGRRPGVIQPVLPPEEDIPKFWFHIDLRTTTSSITLAIRLDNLYLIGFRTPGPAGVWWEFDNNDKPGTHLIRGATWLRFGGAYADLIGQHKDLHTVTLGRVEMAAAVDFLAKYSGGTRPVAPPQGARADEYALPKSKLVKLVVMVPEGLRFFTVCRKVEEKFNDMAAPMTKTEGEQVKEWKKISERVRQWAVKPTERFDDMEKIGIKDKNKAAEIVALVKDEKRRG